MVVSHSHKFAFIHVPKTGGTTITHLLGKLGFTTKCSCMNHIRAGDLRALMTPELFDSYYRFAIVRNPYDLMVSLFYFAKKSKSYRSQSGIGEEELSTFENFMRWRSSLGHSPQVAFMTELDDHSKEIVDKICRFEQYDRDIRSAIDAINARGTANPIILPEELPTMNSTQHAPWEEHYQPGDFSALTVEYMFAADFEFFGYPTLSAK